MRTGFAKRKSLLGAAASGLVTLVAASCGTSTPSTTTTTGLSQATFGTEALWNTVGYGNSYAASVFITPYWSAFSTTDGGHTWKLRMPANISPRRGIAIALTPTQDEAVGFFAYGAQRNSVIFVFGPGHVSAPIFLPGALARVRQAVGLGGGRLYALGSSGSKVSLLATSISTPQWSSLAAGASGGVSAIGFDARGSDGVALLAARAAAGSVTGAYVTANGGRSWEPAAISTPAAGGRLVDAYVPSGFHAKAYEVALTLQSPAGFVTEVAAPGVLAGSPVQPNHPVVGGDPQGDVFSVSGLLGQVPQLSVFDAATSSWQAPVTMSGVAGAVMSVGFSSLRDGIAVASKGGKLVTYHTADGGSSWSQGGSIVAVPSAG
ncbi:MAG: hypothetical protein M0Z47_01330 [Actinomycetota bacterium]|nr:hypothetical protein [Actinomycetota bacterium]